MLNRICVYFLSPKSLCLWIKYRFNYHICRSNLLKRFAIQYFSPFSIGKVVMKNKQHRHPDISETIIVMSDNFYYSSSNHYKYHGITYSVCIPNWYFPLADRQSGSNYVSAKWGKTASQTTTRKTREHQTQINIHWLHKFSEIGCTLPRYLHSSYFHVFVLVACLYTNLYCVNQMIYGSQPRLPWTKTDSVSFGWAHR